MVGEADVKSQYKVKSQYEAHCRAENRNSSAPQWQ